DLLGGKFMKDCTEGIPKWNISTEHEVIWELSHGQEMNIELISSTKLIVEFKIGKSMFYVSKSKEGKVIMGIDKMDQGGITENTPLNIMYESVDTRHGRLLVSSNKIMILAIVLAERTVDISVACVGGCPFTLLHYLNATEKDGVADVKTDVGGTCCHTVMYVLVCFVCI
ncbi:unnamed protein product, partial [Meganyctiphanes norvegica]